MTIRNAGVRRACGARTDELYREVGTAAPRKSAKLRKLLLALPLATMVAGAAIADTVSIGYESLGGGAFTFWYGTYHGGTNFTEGSLRLVGPSFDATVPFTLLTTVKPSGLIDGTTNFYTDGGNPPQLVGTPFINVLVWQGTQFTGLTQPGVYTFTYIPIGNPTADWQPWDDAVLSNNLTITDDQIGLVVTAADLGLPLPGPTAPQAGAKAMTSFLTAMLDPFANSSSGCNSGRHDANDEQCRDEHPSDSRLSYASDKVRAGGAQAAIHSAMPLARVDEAHRYSTWATIYGGQTRATDKNVTATTNVVGVATGLDYRLSRNSRVGFAMGGGATSFGLSQSLGSGKSDIFQVGVYSLSRSGPAYLSAALAYAWNGMSTDRVEVTGDRLVADYNGQNYGGRLEAGYRVNTAFAAITPHAALQVQWFRTPDYSETAASGSPSFALLTDGGTTTFWRTELGLWFDRTIVTDSDASVVLRSRVAWAHDGGSDQTLVAAYQATPGTTFAINGMKPVSDSLLLSAAADFRRGNWLLSAKLDGEFAEGSRSYSGTGTLRYSW